MCYVGVGYACQSPRLVGLGLNLVTWGGPGALSDLIRAAGDLLAKGKKRHFANSGYGGSVFYHRLATYASLLLFDDWKITDCGVTRNGRKVEDDFDRLQDALTKLAYCEAIKCSPPWRGSVPRPPMRERCPQLLLAHELRVLEPDIVLVIGKSTPTSLPIGVASKSAGAVSESVIPTNWGRIRLVRVPHPASNGGSAMKVVQDLARICRMPHP